MKWLDGFLDILAIVLSLQNSKRPGVTDGCAVDLRAVFGPDGDEEFLQCHPEDAVVEFFAVCICRIDDIVDEVSRAAFGAEDIRMLEERVAETREELCSRSNTNHRVVGSDLETFGQYFFINSLKSLCCSKLAFHTQFQYSSTYHSQYASHRQHLQKHLL